jgi:hypothetical protein
MRLQLGLGWRETSIKSRSCSIFEFDRPTRLVLGDLPAVVGPNGVVLVDREVVDPDRGKPGLPVCPGGQVVGFGDFRG